MPIQFRCKKCQGWIEVDDEHAGTQAICPFCQVVSSVPVQSESLISARPVSPESAADATVPPSREKPAETSPDANQDLESSPTDSFPPYQERFDARQAGLPTTDRAALRRTRIGRIGLAMAILSIVLMTTPTVIALLNLPVSLRQRMWQHAPEDADGLRALQKEVMEQTATFMQDHSWLAALGSLGLVLWLTSLAMNISVIFSTGWHRRGSAWAGLAVNTILLFVFLCSGMMQRLIGS
jgi:hypothetical protein